MRALQQTDLTGPDALKLAEVAEPDKGPGVLIDVEAAGVAFPDVLLSRGQYQVKPDPPFIPGTEVAGTVVEAADGVELPARRSGHGHHLRRLRRARRGQRRDDLPDAQVLQRRAGAPGSS